MYHMPVDFIFCSSSSSSSSFSLFPYLLAPSSGPQDTQDPPNTKQKTFSGHVSKTRKGFLCMLYIHPCSILVIAGFFPLVLENLGGIFLVSGAYIYIYMWPLFGGNVHQQTDTISSARRGPELLLLPLFVLFVFSLLYSYDSRAQKRAFEGAFFYGSGGRSEKGTWGLFTTSVYCATIQFFFLNSFSGIPPFFLRGIGSNRARKDGSRRYLRILC
ncbi:hypothetical protein VTG60DRAFT_1245 [Thermothelomyces hinnuleus]